MKFHVRHGGQGDLQVKDFRELKLLYQRQFIEDEDEIRREGTERWVKAGQMPELRGFKPQRYSMGTLIGLVLIGLCVLTVVLAIMRMQ